MYLSKRQSNSCMPCSIMDRDESSQPTFMRAFSTKERGCNWIAFVSSDGGGLWAKFISDKLSLAFRRCGLKIVLESHTRSYLYIFHFIWLMHIQKV